MRNKKLALLLLAIVTAFTMVMAVACKTASEQESSGSESSIEESVGSEEQSSGDRKGGSFSLLFIIRSNSFCVFRAENGGCPDVISNNRQPTDHQSTAFP